MFNKENFISATFADQDRRYVEVLYAHNDEVHPFVVDTLDQDNPDTKRLFEFQDYDTLLESSWQSMRQQRKEFEKTVLQIAKAEGLIPSEKPNETYLDELVFEWDKDNEKHKEALFNLKIRMFEMEHVEKSKKAKAKTDLRKAETPLDALVIYKKI